MDIKVPFRKPAEIEHMVLDLLHKYAKAKGAPPRPPIDVDDIAEKYLKLDLEVTDLKELLKMPDVLGAPGSRTRSSASTSRSKARRDGSPSPSPTRSATGGCTGPSSRWRR